MRRSSLCWWAHQQWVSRNPVAGSGCTEQLENRARGTAGSSGTLRYLSVKCVSLPLCPQVVSKQSRMLQFLLYRDTILNLKCFYVFFNLVFWDFPMCVLYSSFQLPVFHPTHPYHSMPSQIHGPSVTVTHTCAHTHSHTLTHPSLICRVQLLLLVCVYI